MRFGFWLHIAGWLGFLVSGAESSTGADVAAGVPSHAASPPVFAVTAFENHVVNGRALDWIATEAPFEIAEKSQAVLGLDGTDSPLFVPNSPVPAEAEPVAAFARQRRAEFVITGWFDRVGEDLRLAVVVWRVDRSTGARVVGEAKSQGPIENYHAILGNAVADAWTRAGIPVDDAKRQLLGRALAVDDPGKSLTRDARDPTANASRGTRDIYPVFTMGRGLGYFVAGDLKNAEHDLERAVFLDPKLVAAQRLLGELYRRRGEPKDAARAAAKFSYALELDPDDVESLRAAAAMATSMGQWDRALELWTRFVTRRPWDIDARFQFGRAQWQLGNAETAERQLTEVVSHRPDHLAARHVLALIHASRGDTKRLAVELELISVRAPHDLDVKSDLAAAYGALGRWDQAAVVLEALAAARPTDVSIVVRSGDAQRKRGDIGAAIRWYERAARLMPETSMPAYLIALAQFDSGNVAAASQSYANLRRYAEHAAAADHALGVIALAANRVDDAVVYFRRAVQGEPRSLEARQALIAAELERKDHVAALRQLGPALQYWPDDAILHYLAGLASRLSGDNARAHRELHWALDAKVAAARLALDAIDIGSAPRVNWRPALIRPWGDGETVRAELDRFAAIRREMASARSSYQADFFAILGMLGKGPAAARQSVRGCPARAIAPKWLAAHNHLDRYQRLGAELEVSFQRIARHDALGLTAGLLPTQRIAVAAAKRDYKFALQDTADLRAQWVRGLVPELAVAGCSAAALAAMGADPSPNARRWIDPTPNSLNGSAARPGRAGAIDDEAKEPPRKLALPRSAKRVTFFVDNTGCPEAVDVYVDDSLIGRAAAGQRSAWPADGGDRSLCLILPGTGQCGDRGTVRRAYLHDGWTVTMRCPK